MRPQIGQFTAPKSGQEQGGSELSLQPPAGERPLVTSEEALLDELPQHLKGGEKGQVVSEFGCGHL